MKMYEILASIKQAGNRRNVKIVVQADNQIVAKELANAEYSGSDLKLIGLPREIKSPKPKK